MKKLMAWSAFLGGSFLAAALGLVICLGMNRAAVSTDAGAAAVLAGPSGSGEQPKEETLQAASDQTTKTYERIVILDVEASDELTGPEKEALYRIEKKCGELLEREGILTYGVSETDKEAGMDEKLTLVEETNASLYLGLMFDKDEDKELFGSYVCYNSLYFRPWLTNGSFADRMERSVVTAIEGRALGLVEVEEGILQEMSIPAAIVCPGYLSHEKEGKLLLTESYQDRIAEGICSGVIETFKELE